MTGNKYIYIYIYIYIYPKLISNWVKRFWSLIIAEAASDGVFQRINNFLHT